MANWNVSVTRYPVPMQVNTIVCQFKGYIGEKRGNLIADKIKSCR